MYLGSVVQCTYQSSKVLGFNIKMLPFEGRNIPTQGRSGENRAITWGTRILFQKLHLPQL